MRYLVYNGPMQTTAAPVGVTTGTAIKTLLQIKPIVPVRIVEFGISFNGSAAATPIKVELIETGTVNATVTAFVDNDVTKFDFVGDGVAGSVGALTLATSGSGYTASAEGTTTAVRNLMGPQYVPPTGGLLIQFPLGERPTIIPANIGRVRVHATAAVDALTYLILEA